MLDGAGIDFDCPQCGHKIMKTIGWLTSHKDMAFPGCGVTINFNTDELTRAVEQIEDALKGVPKEITIKF